MPSKAKNYLICLSFYLREETKSSKYVVRRNMCGEKKTGLGREMKNGRKLEKARIKVVLCNKIIHNFIFIFIFTS